MLDRQKMNAKHECPVVLKLVQGRRRCFIPLALKVKWEDWNFKKSLLKEKRGTLEEKIEQQKGNLYLESEVLKIKKILLDFTMMEKVYTLEEVVKSYQYPTSTGGYVYDYMRNIVDSLEKLGKNGNSNVYRGTMGVLQNFHPEQDLTFEGINYSFIKNFEIYLQRKGCKVNTISLYLRTLRSVYNRAIRDGIVAEEYYPFKKITIRKEKTMKRAIYKEEIAAIRDLNISSCRMGLARDIFLFSFYMRGMSFKDIAFLSVSSIVGERLYYSRQKTAQKLNIKITDKAWEIIRKYNDLSDRTSYIFPLIQYPGKNEYHQYKNAYREVNRRLKLIGTMLHFHFPLTTYVARHSWASIAKRSGIPISVISEGLGHDSERTTQIYLDSFENNVLDAANEIITDF